MKRQVHAAKMFHVRAADRAYLTANLAMLIQANVAVGEALASLRQTAKSRTLRAALAQLEQDIDEGMPLWKALERSGIASQQTLALVEIGEKSGNLAENLHVASLQEQKQRLFAGKVRSALLYPGFVVALTVVVGLGIAWFLLPNLARTFSELHVQLPFITRVFIGIGQFLQAYGVWAVPSFVVALLVVLYALFALPRTKAVGQALLFHTPGISRLLHEVELARFGYLLGTLLDAGLGITEALSMLQRATASQPYAKLYAHVHDALDNGFGFAAALGEYPASTKFIPPNVQQMIFAGEQSGALPETFKNIGSIYEEQVDATTQNLEAILEPVLLVIVALGVLVVAIAVILPIYGLVSGLNG